ncbi:hypothetical protein Sjap_006741 [Stephania japonica]|uniref:Uncharacterized protein n=1 Tax=Stephania japonica TaxID=461633 RepID=A0AAP0K825_9MAGN
MGPGGEHVGHGRAPPPPGPIGFGPRPIGLLGGCAEGLCNVLSSWTALEDHQGHLDLLHLTEKYVVNFGSM